MPLAALAGARRAYVALIFFVNLLRSTCDCLRENDAGGSGNAAPSVDPRGDDNGDEIRGVVEDKYRGFVLGVPGPTRQVPVGMDNSSFHVLPKVCWKAEPGVMGVDVSAGLVNCAIENNESTFTVS
jgi:hypothetical protein